MFCAIHQGESRELYRGLRTESRRLGMRPCFKVDANARMCFFAPSKFPVVKKSPRSEMKTSRPQHLAQPAAKWGNPAANDGVALPGSSDAEVTCPCIWTEHKARSCVKLWPDTTNSDICSMMARRDTLYASEMTMAKNLGRRKDGTLDLIRSNLSLNHCAGFEIFGKMFVCL